MQFFKTIVETLHELGKLFLIHYSFTCINITILTTLCFFYNDSGYTTK